VAKKQTNDAGQIMRCPDNFTPKRIQVALVRNIKLGTVATFPESSSVKDILHMMWLGVYRALCNLSRS